MGELAIKGPGYRLDLDARRTWQCPSCGQRWKTPGDVVTTTCSFCNDHPTMKWVEDFPAHHSPKHALGSLDSYSNRDDTPAESETVQSVPPGEQPA